MELHEALAARVREWRDAGYPHDRYPAIAEILGFAIDGDGPQAPLRYLRAAQLRALETYWYLRLVAHTPRIEALYRDLFPDTSDRLAALGLGAPVLKDIALNIGYEGLLERIRTDDALVHAHRLEAQRETLTLDYPSWILALAMGAGKTVLIGAIDPSYDGSVFEVGMLDVPARKRDLVEGTYEVAVDAASSEPVAVRITDMLGEEILVLEPRVSRGD